MHDSIQVPLQTLPVAWWWDVPHWLSNHVRERTPAISPAQDIVSGANDSRRRCKCGGRAGGRRSRTACEPALAAVTTSLCLAAGTMRGVG
jgi:hypothetical protein